MKHIFISIFKSLKKHIKYLNYVVLRDRISWEIGELKQNGIKPIIKIFCTQILFIPIPFQTLGATISVGKVLYHDLNNSIPLEYANIQVQGKTIGCVTNSEGIFEFDAKLMEQKDTLIISFLGFEPKIIPITKLFLPDNKDTLKIILEKCTYTLSAVKVYPEELNPEKILKTAITKIKDNYPRQPFRTKGFYREIERENSEYVKFIEASLDIYCDDFVKKKILPMTAKEDIKICAFSKKYDFKKCTSAAGMNKLNLLLLSSNLDFLKEINFSNFSFFLDSTFFSENQRIYNIKCFSKIRSDTIDLLIRSEDFAIIELKSFYPLMRDTLNIFGSESSMIVDKVNRFVKFKNISGKYYPSYSELALEVKYFNKETKALKCKYEDKLQLMTYDIITTDPEEIPKKEQMSKWKSFESQAGSNINTPGLFDHLVPTILEKSIESELSKIQESVIQK